MLVKLPPVWELELRSDHGWIRSLAVPTTTVDCTSAVRYTRERDQGYALTLDGFSRPVILFPSKPRSGIYTADEYVLIAQFDDALETAAQDFTKGIWWRHPALPETTPTGSELAAAALASWRNGFRFVLEDPAGGTIGLRKPQVGALHAIHAHWSTTSEIATVVMPTGTGKTETMLSTVTSAQCARVLVVVPTDALRTQITEKFETLGVLKAPNATLLAVEARRPVVGKLTSKPRTPEELDAFFGACNVIVTTSQLIGGCTPPVQQRASELCTHLFIDEAHHAEAPTWKRFRAFFKDSPILQFTATPFREDGQKVDGKLIYVYPLRQAQRDGYFRPIRFRQVLDFDPDRGDRKIAEAALDALDADTTGRHIVMARVSSVDRATTIYRLYAGLGRYEVVVIHSSLSARDREQAKERLFSGQARVVVCVDMLGEGFDLPELKIAAFHDIRKSLAVTLQLAGRFTRARQDLGDPVFIANAALIDVRDELRTLYSQDPDWNILLPDLSTAAIEGEIAAQNFFAGFDRHLDEVPLHDVRPAASMVVYHTECANWRPRNYSKGFRGLSVRDKIFSSVNEIENTLVIIAGSEEPVRWSDVESIQDWRWELFVAVWDRERELLYIHGANNTSDYKPLAKALCGQTVRIVVEPNVYRCFHGINRLVLNNVGLNEHIGRQLRYTGRMGSDVEGRIPIPVRQSATKAVLAGMGYENGGKASVGAAKRGRVWSNQRLRVDSFATWARSIGAKLVDDSIDPHAVLEGTLKPRAVDSVPRKTAIGVDWPSEVYERSEHGTVFVRPNGAEDALTYVGIELAARDDSGPLVIRVFGDGWEAKTRLRIFANNNSFDFDFLRDSGVRLEVRQGTASVSLEDFFTSYPPIVWFSDGSSLEGSLYVELPSASELGFARDRLNAWDWSGVDITRESQGESRLANTVQFSTIRRLEADGTYQVIFDDDDAGEAADVVAIRVLEGERTAIEVELYHCKFSGAAHPGARVDDLYVVCGQAQRSVSWLASRDRRTELFVHLLKRESKRTTAGRASRYERGDDAALARIRDLSRQAEVRLKVFVVQPGVSKAAASAAQLQICAVTERYLTETYAVPFGVICSA